MWQIIGGVCSILGLLITILINIVVLTRFSTKQEVTLQNLTKSFGEFKDEIKKTVAEKINEVKTDFKEHLGRVEKKQDKHNSVIERTFAIEKTQSVQGEQIKVINHRIQDLEKTR